MVQDWFSTNFRSAKLFVMPKIIRNRAPLVSTVEPLLRKYQNMSMTQSFGFHTVVVLALNNQT